MSITNEIAEYCWVGKILDTPKHQNWIDIEQTERDMSRRVRNYCKLEPKEVKADEQTSKSKIITNAWDKPYQSHVKRDNNQGPIIEERYANSRVALRSTVEQKRNAYRKG